MPMSDSCTCACASTPRRRRPTATLVIASLALFMSLGGTSYAAVKAKSIGTKQLKNNAVTSGKIARNGVTASDIRAGVVDGSKIKTGAIDSSKIQFNSIGSQHILDASIGAQDIQPGSIGAREIANGSLDAQKIADGSLSPNEFGTAMTRFFRDVPAELWLKGGENTSAQGMPSTGTGSSTDSFTTVRSYSAPALAVPPATDQTGTNLVQSSVAVSSTNGAAVSCWISVGQKGTKPEDAKIIGTSTVDASQHSIVPVTGVAVLSEGSIVETRCRADAGPDQTSPRTATADTRAATGATSMTLIRVAD
jgi:hypothetical protein